MNLKRTKLRDAINLALCVGASSLLYTGLAMAQEPAPAPAPAAKKDVSTLERVEVTGSRIKRADIETSQPIFSLTRDEIQAQGLTSIGDVIQNLSANGSTLNTTFNNGGNGETRVSLRNLGSNRTLVLVNGRRWVGGTGLGGAVDLNTIPTAAVERIEVLKDGASVIYGSDAISGVVNVILRTDYEGAEANAYYGQFEKGDGARQSYDFTVGSVGDRWSAMMGISYVKEEPVMAGDRSISKEPVFGTGTAFGSTTSPFGRFAVCAGGFNASTGVCTGPQTRPDGSAGQFTYDPGASGTNWRPFAIPADVYNFAPDNFLLTPQERVSFFGSGSLNITDHIRFKNTITYNERKSEQLLAAMPIVLGTGPGAGVQSRTVFISKDSIYNPFGVDVSRIQRRAVETGGRSFVQDVDTFVYSGGLEGDFQIGDRYFTWEAGYMYGKNERNDTTEGLFNVPALRQALGPSMLVNGVPTCVTTPGNASTAIAGCVPLNLLGAPGTITQDMLDFTSFVAHDEFGYKQKTYYANLTGDLFELPAGPLSFAFGLEHRTEFGFDQPDALINSGNTTGNARTATRGGYNLDEAYLELAVPILKDLPFAKLLDASIATRHSDYSNFGSTDNSKIGLRWKPIEDLLVRYNYTEGFRAPSVSELFTGVSDSFPTIADPCNLARFPTLTPAQQARCVAQGVPANGYDQGNAQIRISVGGNVNLQPESSKTRTFGFVYSPSYVEGLDVSLDWWKIDLSNTITVFTGRTILDNCILDNNPQFCNLYNRFPGGAIDTLLSTTTNVGNARVEGYDMTIGYRMPETAWGKFSLVMDTTYLQHNYTDVNGDGRFDNQLKVPKIGDPFFANEGGDATGRYSQNNNNWRIRSNLALRWELGDFGATWNARYYSHQNEDCQSFVDYGYDFLCSDPNRSVGIPTDLNGNGVWDGPTIDAIVDTPAARNRIGSTTYHDVSAYWKAPWNAQITLGINNLFEKEPPRSVDAFANSFDPQYEVPGRFFYVRYSQKF